MNIQSYIMWDVSIFSDVDSLYNLKANKNMVRFIFISQNGMLDNRVPIHVNKYFNLIL